MHINVIEVKEMVLVSHFSLVFCGVLFMQKHKHMHTPSKPVKVIEWRQVQQKHTPVNIHIEMEVGKEKKKALTMMQTNLTPLIYSQLMDLFHSFCL